MSAADEEDGDAAPEAGTFSSTVVSLKDLPSWPLPPPSPPSMPPSMPPQLHRGNMTDAQLECQFEQGIDLSVSGDAHVTSSAHSVDSQTQCCALCAMQDGCSRFVFIPGSGACAMFPHVPKAQIIRTSNPATVSGTVFIARAARDAPAVEHARCAYEVGYSYVHGALGAGRPIDGPHITSQQECCDACERNAECVKFVFEKFGGGCQLFESFAEKYRTPGLIAGHMLARTGMAYLAGAASRLDAESPPPHPPLRAPPVPPSFVVALLAPPPAPPPGEGEAAQVLLEYASIAIGGIIVFGLLLCTYCFYFGEIQGALHVWTRGRLGQAKFSLLPKTLQELDGGGGANGGRAVGVDDDGGGGRRSRRRGGDKRPKLLMQQQQPQKGVPAAGLASLTCATQSITQRKDVDVAACDTLDELLDVAWEEFGHLLKQLRKKDVAMLCWVGGGGGGSEGPGDTAAGQWLTVTPSSVFERVRACTYLKLVEKKSVAAGVPEAGVAFPKALPPARRPPPAAQPTPPPQPLQPPAPAEPFAPQPASSGLPPASSQDAAEVAPRQPAAEAPPPQPSAATLAPGIDPQQHAALIEAVTKLVIASQQTPQAAGHMLAAQPLSLPLPQQPSLQQPQQAPPPMSPPTPLTLAAQAQQQLQQPAPPPLPPPPPPQQQQPALPPPQPPPPSQPEAADNDDDDAGSTVSYAMPSRAPATYLTTPYLATFDEDPPSKANDDIDQMSLPPPRPINRRSAASAAFAREQEREEQQRIAAAQGSGGGIATAAPPPSVERLDQPPVSAEVLAAAAAAAAYDADSCDAPFLLSEMGEGMVGKRVEVHGLKDKSELNGRGGRVASYERAKDRYKVRLDAQSIDGLPTVLGFRAQNLKLV